MTKGKVIVLTGPKSSGKTSLMHALIKSGIMHFVTISKKLIVMESMISFGEKEYLRDLINEVSQIFNRKVTLFELFKVNYPIAVELIRNIQEIADSHYEEYTSILYINYIREIKKFTDSGRNVIIDDTFLNFGFGKFSDYGSGIAIKKLLLYDNLEGLLSKSNIRNGKFIRLLQQADDIERFQVDLAAKETELNESGFSLRYPADIIKDYTDFYKFKTNINSEEVALDKITQPEISRLISIIYETQAALEKTLKDSRYPNTYQHREKMHYELLIRESFKDNDMCFVVPKLNIDFVQMAQQISSIELLKNREFLLYFFRDIKYWIEDNTNISIIFQEWALWSKCYGKVLVINGVSSSGKTTLSKTLMKLGFNHISLDNVFFDLFYNEVEIIMPFIRSVKSLTKKDILAIFDSSPQLDKTYTTEQLNELHAIEQQLTLIDKSFINNIHISLQKRIEQVFEETKRCIARGENVVIDTVMYKESIDKFLTIFNYPHKIILLYTPLEQNLMNCFSRPIDEYRYPAKIISQFMEMYQFNSNGSQGMMINREKVLSAFEYIRSNLNERFYFFPTLQFLDMQKKTEEAMKEVKILLKGSNEIFISSHMVYDLAIIIPQAQITNQLLSFLIYFAQQRDNNIELLDIPSDFIAFHKNGYALPAEHYYYHTDERILDRTLISGGNNFEVIEDL